MPRTARVAPGGMVFHVLNRGVGRMRLFYKDADYEAFERYLEKTLETCPMRICSYCLMPNHWHLLLWPENDGDLGRFMQKLTVTHVRNWQEYRKKVGMGHVYQGRYKSFPVESNEYFYQVARYIERNALRAKLVPRAKQWRWSSLWRRVHGDPDQRKLLSKWPLPQPRKWIDLVQRAQTKTEVEAIRSSVNKGIPFGTERWVKATAKQLGIESTMRPRGRPRKKQSD